ncbi:hypothetical protein [Xanthomonas oryzae]|uniref:hypothetical protein n=1 Tax=Xanthomonas oryzae TaxID=347 RepID=UPI0010585974|nr:hypothetical protein [Xanthomonas oryzae]
MKDTTMKLCDPDLDRQLRAGVDRYEQLPAWMKEASSDREVIAREGMQERNFSAPSVQEES